MTRAVAALALLTLALSTAALTTAPGHLSFDESTYHLMVRALARGEGFTIENGWELLPSEERALAVVASAPHVAPHGGRLVAQYPQGFPALALPAYLLFGYRGLALMNALALAVTLGVIGWAAPSLTGVRATRWTAPAVLLGTFATQYGLEAWPHATAMAATTGALALTLTTTGWRPALAAGLLVGLGTTVRLDAILVLGAIVAVEGLRRPLPWLRFAALGLGLAPGMVALALTNLWKFGVFSPVTYGSTGSGDLLVRFAPFLAAGALGGLAWLAWSLESVRRRSPWLLVGVAGALLVTTVLVFPGASRRLWGWLQGGATLLVDLRWLPERQEPGMGRLPGGAVVYAGGLKKALLQSLPWLPLALVPFAAPELAHRVLRLLVFPALLLALFANWAWHGGLCLNLRYFVPALPWLSLAGAWGLHLMAAQAPRAVPAAAAGGLAMGLGAWVVLSNLDGAAGELGVILDLPLLLAAALAVLCAVGHAVPSIARLAVAVGVACVVWSAAVALGYDHRLSQARRWEKVALAQELAVVVPDGALLLVADYDRTLTLIGYRDVDLANPFVDGLADLPRLVQASLSVGQPVLAAFPARGWATLEARGTTHAWRLEPIGNAGDLEVRRFVGAR